MNSERHLRGFTVSEMVVAVAIVGVAISMAVPGTQRFLTDQDANGMARTVANVFQLARTEALVTGHNHVVFLGIGGAGDVAGNPLLDENGRPAAILILDDGPPGSPNQNCEIDPGEPTRVVEANARLSWGYAKAGGTKAPGDLSGQAAASGSSFATPAGAGTTWVLFRPDGTPAAFDAACNTGAVGSGNGAVYFTNGTSDQAVVLSALGNSRVHTWNRQSGSWTN